MPDKADRKHFRDQALTHHQQQFGDYCCRLCGKCLEDWQLQAHHVLPKNSGGVNDAYCNSCLVGKDCHVELHDKYSGRLTRLGQLLLEGFKRNSKQRSYNLKKKCEK